MKIGVTADSSSCLGYAPFEHQIPITKTSILFSDREYIDGVDITADQFYKMLKERDEIPSTAAPTTGEIIKAVALCKEKGCTDVIHFPISFGLSKYGENLESLLPPDMLDGVHLHVYDSGTACIMEGYLAYYASILAEKGYSLEEIYAQLDLMRKQTCAYFVVDDLKYLVKNGRLSSASGWIGTMARVKPILKLGEAGIIETYKKVLTKKVAVQQIKSLIKEQFSSYEKVIYIVLYNGDKSPAEKLYEELPSLYENSVRNDLTIITPTVGAHIGSGILAIAAIAVDGLKEKFY